MVSIHTKIVVPVEEFKMRIIITRHVDGRQPLQILVSDKDRSTRTIFSMAMAQFGVVVSKNGTFTTRVRCKIPTPFFPDRVEGQRHIERQRPSEVGRDGDE